MAFAPSAPNPAPSALISARRRRLMQRCSETIGAIAERAGQGADRTAKPGEVADGNDPLPVPAGRGTELPLRVLIQWVGSGAQVAGPA